MKNSLNIIILSICFIITCSGASYPLFSIPDSNAVLEIEGKILNSRDGGTDCRVALICSGAVVDSLILKDGKKKFRLILKKNLQYSIRISKKGYVSKLIIVYTKITPQFEGLYEFSFDTRLIASAASERLNKQALGQPIAIISFVEKKECFDYSKEYTSRIKKEMLATK